MLEFALVTFGCQMNRHDSERIRELLRASGYRETQAVEQADLVLVNTCSVREKAVQKLRSELGRLARLKQVRPGLLLGVAGCLAQQEGQRLCRAMRFLDLVVSPDRLPALPGLLRELEGGSPPRVCTGFDLDQPRFLSVDATQVKKTPTAYVTVSKGCSERCTFCIVPHTRGPARNRTASEILNEIKSLVAGGVREVTLLGQTVNNYQDPAGQRQDFAALLRAIVTDIPSLCRLRYMSPHPCYMGVGVVRAHQELEPLCRHVHLPVQSGSDPVLRRMGRGHTMAQYRQCVETLKDRVPGLTLSTDIIVGFPGESRGDFEATLHWVEEIGFTGVFGFKYSPRPATAALRFGDDISEEEKSQRLAELFALSGRLLARHLEQLVGRFERVLVEGSTRAGRYTGRTPNNEIVHFDSAWDLTGEVVEVRITQAFKHSLGAELAGTPPLPATRPRLHVIGAERASGC